MTGWRVGWLIGPSKLIRPTLLAHSRIVFCTSSPLQEAIATGLEKAVDNGFFEQQVSDYRRKRDFLVQVFEQLGLCATVPGLALMQFAFIKAQMALTLPWLICQNCASLVWHYIMYPADVIADAELRDTEVYEERLIGGAVPRRSKDWKICRWLTVKIGVAAIPPSEFYGADNSKMAEKYARFCFCKTDETLKAAADRLQALRDYIASE